MASAIWLGAHLVLALIYAHDHRSHVVLAAAVALAIFSTLVAVRPLLVLESWAHERLTGMEAVAMMTAPGLVEVAVAPFLGEDAISGYANWPLGGMCVIIAAAVVRHRVEVAAAATALILAVNAYFAWRMGVVLVHIIFLSVPPVLWLVASIAVRRVLNVSAKASWAYRQRASEELAALEVARAIRDAERARLSELEDTVPLLSRAISAPTVDGDLMLEAERHSSQLRDSLRARCLVSGPVRAAIAAARARGVTVTVSADETADEGNAPALIAQELLVALPEAMPAGSSLTLRLTRHPLAVTVIAAGHAEVDSPRIVALIQAGVPDAWRVATTNMSDGLVTHVTPPRENGAP